MQTKTSQLRRLDKQYIWHPFTHMSQWLADDQLVITAAQGMHLIDSDGNTYLDGVSSLWCNVHGHRVPEIDDAIRAQLDKVAHTTMLGLANEPATILAERLMRIVPPGLAKVFYSDSGATATEVAFKLAAQYWFNVGKPQKNEFVGFTEAYHGDTLGAMSVGRTPAFHRPYFPLLFKTHFAPTPFAYRYEYADSAGSALADAGHAPGRDISREVDDTSQRTTASAKADPTKSANSDSSESAGVTAFSGPACGVMVAGKPLNAVSPQSAPQAGPLNANARFQGSESAGVIAFSDPACGGMVAGKPRNAVSAQSAPQAGPLNVNTKFQASESAGVIAFSDPACGGMVAGKLLNAVSPQSAPQAGPLNVNTKFQASESAGVIAFSDPACGGMVAGKLLNAVSPQSAPQAGPLNVDSQFTVSENMGRVRDDALWRLEQILAKNAARIAAVCIEPIVQGAAGMIVHPPGFLTGVRRLCTKYDVLMIADEVAVGFGRTGKMFACEHENVSPDLMCVAKGITGGYLPLAATFATQKIFDAFLGEPWEGKTFFHGHTYTGNPLAAAAALASLDLFEKNDVVNAVAEKSKALAGMLDDLRDLPHVGDIRQKGFMVGIELVADKESRTPFDPKRRVGAEVCLSCRKHGVLIRPLGDVIVLMPPLAMGVEDLRKIVEAVNRGLFSLP